jgi:hypothetical protein
MQRELARAQPRPLLWRLPGATRREVPLLMLLGCCSSPVCHVGFGYIRSTPLLVVFGVMVVVVVWWESGSKLIFLQASGMCGVMLASPSSLSLVVVCAWLLCAQTTLGHRKRQWQRQQRQQPQQLQWQLPGQPNCPHAPGRTF